VNQVPWGVEQFLLNMWYPSCWLDEAIVLSVLLLAIVLYVLLQLSASDYSFGNIKLFFLHNWYTYPLIKHYLHNWDTYDPWFVSAVLHLGNYSTENSRPAVHPCQLCLPQQLPLKMASSGIIKQMNMNRHVENR
jgi:hypothetical protein